MTTLRGLGTDSEIYDFSIEAISRALQRDLKSNDLLDLSSLRPFVEQLRDSYGQSQKSHGHVSVSYDNETALAYMCAYFPAYVKLAKQSIQTVLKTRKLDLRSFDTFNRIAILGSGPGPELAAIAHYLGTSREPEKSLEVHLLDRNHAGWSRCTQAVIETTKSYFPGTSIAIHEHDVDFTSPDFRGTIKRLPKVDFVLGQNLANEASLSVEVFVQNILALNEQCESEGTVLLVDQKNASTYKCFSQIKNLTPHDITCSWEPQELTISWPKREQHKALWTVFSSEPGDLIPRGKIHTHRLQLQRKSQHG
jgi:hypothetical protein